MMLMYTCSACGKPLLRRLDNGLWSFQFGRYGKDNNAVVDMEIHGSVRMKCLRKSCRSENVLHAFPGASA